MPQCDGWWRERTLFLALLLIGGAYFFRFGTLPLRGEEPRWTQVAREMVWSGDWVVPREQGEPFTSRPPLHSWLIAACAAVCGSWEPWVVRLPSVLALLTTCTLLYGYTRIALPPLGSLAVALAFGSMGGLHQMGRIAETEALYLCLLSGSLLVWHWGYLRAWRPWRMWSAAYLLLALAALCKGGAQPPVYFAGTVGLYLLLQGQLSRLLTRGHVVGLLVGLLVVAAWYVPCALRIGLEQTQAIWINDTATRFKGWTFTKVLSHLLIFPWEFLGTALPWSLLLPLYLNREVRQNLGTFRPLVVFNVVAIVVAFPTCWLPPGGMTRYLASLYPCLAVLAGGAVGLLVRGPLPTVLRHGWRDYVRVAALLLAALGVCLLATSCLPLGWLTSRFGVPPLLAFLYGGLFLLLGGFLWLSATAIDPIGVLLTTLAVTAGTLLFGVTLGTDWRAAWSVDTAHTVAELRQTLPPDARLISYDHVPALFRYYHGQPIEPRPWPQSRAAARGVDYFAVGPCFGPPPPLPFEWEQVAAIPVMRFTFSAPTYTYIGRPVQASARP